jgi:cyclic pyranopterin phosphate synthase
MSNTLSHFNESGRASMVNVGSKQVSSRTAVARSLLQISPGLVSILKAGDLEKGDAFTVAKTAGILAAKLTGNLIPMCHPLPVDYIEIAIEMPEHSHQVRIEATVSTTAKTGVEMEALVAVTMAGLTFYDMCKAVDKGIKIVNTGLYKKTGGKSGDYLNREMEW